MSYKAALTNLARRVNTSPVLKVLSTDKRANRTYAFSGQREMFRNLTYRDRCTSRPINERERGQRSYKG